MVWYRGGTRQIVWFGGKLCKLIVNFLTCERQSSRWRETPDKTFLRERETFQSTISPEKKNIKLMLLLTRHLAWLLPGHSSLKPPSHPPPHPQALPSTSTHLPPVDTSSSFIEDLLPNWKTSFRIVAQIQVCSWNHYDKSPLEQFTSLLPEFYIWVSTDVCFSAKQSSWPRTGQPLHSNV